MDAERIPLSISPNYVQWGFWQAIRELFQNGMDSHDKGNKLNFGYTPETKNLVIRNLGATLPRNTLVLGVSDKKNDASQRGEFGEGYKLACATLLRLGCRVYIHTGAEIWVPEIAHSKEFNTDILWMKITKAEPKVDSLTFSIYGIPEDEWKLAVSRLLFLQTYPEHIPTGSGKILTAKEHANKLYVRGIYVDDLSDGYEFGYDLNGLKLDRDRQMANAWDLKSGVAQCIRNGIESGRLEANTLIRILDEERGEKCVAEFSIEKSDFIRKIAESFATIYGADAVPVQDIEQSAIAASAGLKGIVVSTPLLKLLLKQLMPYDKVVKLRLMDVEKRYSIFELSKEELDNLKWAVETINKYEPCSLSKLQIVDFKGNHILGKFVHQTKEINLARSLLTKRADLISTLVHEQCHAYGGDLTIQHRDACERVFGKIIEGK